MAAAECRAPQGGAAFKIAFLLAYYEIIKRGSGES